MRPTCEKRRVKFADYHGINVKLPDHMTAVGEYTHAQGQFMLKDKLNPGDRFEFDLHGSGIIKIQGFGSKNEANCWLRSRQPLGRGCIRIRTRNTLRYSVIVPPQGFEITLICKKEKQQRQDRLAGCILVFDIECGDVQVILHKSSNVTFDTLCQSAHVEVSDNLRICTATLKHQNPLGLCTPLNCSLKPGKIFILRVSGPDSDRATGSYVRICIAGQHNLYCNQGDEKCIGTSSCPEVKGKRLKARAQVVYEYILRVEEEGVSIERYVQGPIKQINPIEKLDTFGKGECAFWFELHRVTIELFEYRVKNDFEIVDSPPDYPAPPPPIHPARTLLRQTNIEDTSIYNPLHGFADDLPSLPSSTSSQKCISIQRGDESSSYVSADSDTNRSLDCQNFNHATFRKTVSTELLSTDEAQGDDMNLSDYSSDCASCEPTTLTNTDNNETGFTSPDLHYYSNHFGPEQRTMAVPITPKPHHGKKSLINNKMCHIDCRTLSPERCQPTFGYETPGDIIFSPSATSPRPFNSKSHGGRSGNKIMCSPMRSKSFSPGKDFCMDPSRVRCRRDPFYPPRGDASKIEQCKQWVASINLETLSSPCSEEQREWPISPYSPDTDYNICSVSQIGVNSDEESSFFISYNHPEPEISHNIHIQQEDVAGEFSGGTLPTTSLNQLPLSPPPPIQPRSLNYVNGRVPARQMKHKSENTKFPQSETLLKNIDTWSACSEMSIDEETFLKVPRHTFLELPREINSRRTSSEEEETFTKLPLQNELSKDSGDFSDDTVVRRERTILGRNIVESCNINETPPPPSEELVTVLQPSPVVTSPAVTSPAVTQEVEGGFQRSNTFKRNINTTTPPCNKKSYPSKRDLGK